MDKSILLAQQIVISGHPIQGPLVGINNLGDLINKIMEFLTPLALVILLLVFIWAGYDFMMSQGNPEKVKSAQAKLTTGIIGFILLVSAYMIVKLISVIFDLGGGTI